MTLEPYLFFEGRCEEALNFYREVLGGTIEFMMRFGDAPPGTPTGGPPPEKIMHATMRIGSTQFFAADGHCKQPANFQGFSLSLLLEDETAAERIFSALSAGGSVGMPLSQTFFAKKFGMIKDRFGVSWMIRVE